MRRPFAKKIKRITKSILIQTQCVLLLVKNLLFLKMLSVKSVILYDKVVIEGNEVELIWEVTGCHKIKIKRVGTIIGKIHGVKFKMADVSKPIEVCFYGIFKKRRKIISFIGEKIFLLNHFYSEPEIPYSIVKQNNNVLENKLSMSIFKINLKEIYFEFDSFDQAEFQPKNTGV